MIGYLDVFSPSELEEIHLATVDIMQNLGVLVEYQEALEVFEKAGCRVNLDNGSVRIPYSLLSSSLAKCSPVIRLYSQGGLPPLKVGGRNIHFGLQGQVTNVVDWKTGERHPATTKDLEEAARLSDVLENVTFMDPPCGLADVPPELQDRYRWKIPLLNCRKHVMNSTHTIEGVHDAVEIAGAITGGVEKLKEQPIISFLIIVESPLAICEGPSSVIMEVSKFGLPMLIEAGPVCGASSPGTLAGTTVSVNAVVLSSIVLAKLVNPNVPVIYASWARTLDMKTGSVAMGGPEFALLRAATAQLGRYYGLPSGGGAIHTDSKLPDIQMGYEKMATMLLPCLAGLNLLVGMSLIDRGRAMSLEALVIEDELVSYVRRILQGVQVDSDRLATDILESRGYRGSFLSDAHTRKYHRDEMWIPQISDRGFGLEQWLREGAPSLRQRVQKEVQKKLESPIHHQLSGEIEERIDEIIQSRAGAMDIGS